MLVLTLAGASPASRETLFSLPVGAERADRMPAPAGSTARGGSRDGGSRPGERRSKGAPRPGGVQGGEEGRREAGEARLSPAPGGRKVPRKCPAGDVRVLPGVNRDSETDVRAGAAEICSVDKSGAGGIQLHDERVEYTAAERGLERTSCGRKVGGGREARDVRVADR